MTNVAMTLPYLFIAAAFPAFKRKTGINKPFEVFRAQKIAYAWATIILLTIGFANIFSIIQPALTGDVPTTQWSVAGPIIFALAAMLLYDRYERKRGF